MAVSEKEVYKEKAQELFLGDKEIKQLDKKDGENK